MSDGRVQIDAILDDSGVTSGVARIKASLKSIKSADSAVDFSGIKSAGSALAGIGKTLSIGVTAPMAALGKSIVGTSVNFLSLRQDAHVAFTTMMGSAEAASQMLQRLYTFAKTTPFSYDSILQASQSLVAMGMNAEDVVPTLKAVGDAAASSGKGQAAFAAITDTLGKMSAQSNVSLDDMWSLSDNGVQALQILANKAGVSVEDMRKRISDGAVGSKWAIDALVDGIENGTDGVAGSTAKMGGQMSSLKQTWTGATDTMRSAWRNFALAAMGESDNVASSSSKVLDSLVPMVHGVTELLNTAASKMREAGVSVTPIIDKVTELLGKLNDKIASMSPDQVRAVAKALMLFAAAGPVLTVAGKAIEKVGGALEKVGKLRETVSRVKDALSGIRGAADGAASAGEALSSAMGSASESNRIYANSADDAALKTHMAEQAQKALEEANGAATASVEKGAEAMASSKAASVEMAAATMASNVAFTAAAAAVVFGAMAVNDYVTKQRNLHDATVGLTQATGSLASGSRDSAGAFREQGDAADSASNALEGLYVDVDASTERQAQLKDKIEATHDSYKSGKAELEGYVRTINDLANKSGLSADEQARLELAVKGFNKVTGESISIVDAQNGKLSENTDKINEMMKAWEDTALAEANSQALSDIIKEEQTKTDELSVARDRLSAVQDENYKRYVQGHQSVEEYNTELRTEANNYADLVEQQKAVSDSKENIISKQRASVAASEAEKAGLSDVAVSLAGLTAENKTLYDTLDKSGISVNDFSKALSDAGVTADNWSSSGDAVISTLESMGVELSDAQKHAIMYNETPLKDKEAEAKIEHTSVGDAVGILLAYDGTPIRDKYGNAVVASQTVVDAEGNIRDYNGEEVMYKDAVANVNDMTLVDATGHIVEYNATDPDYKSGIASVVSSTVVKSTDNIRTYNRTNPQRKSASVSISDNINSVIGRIRSFNNMSLVSKSATVTTTYVTNIVKNTLGHAKGGILVPQHASGAIIHPLATGGIVNRPTLLNLVGEDGAEAVFPLTNKRYSSVFAGTLAEELMKVLGRMPGTGSGIDWNASTGMHQSAMALGIAADKLGTIGDALSAGDASTRGDTGGSMSMQAMTDLLSKMDRQVVNIYLNDVQVNSDEEMRTVTREYVEMLYRKAVGNVG